MDIRILVDLDGWAPGEDVDRDALVLEEVRRYRQIIKDECISEEGWQMIWDAMDLIKPSRYGLNDDLTRNSLIPPAKHSEAEMRANLKEHHRHKAT